MPVEMLYGAIFSRCGVIWWAFDVASSIIGCVGAGFELKSVKCEVSKTIESRDVKHCDLVVDCLFKCCNNSSYVVVVTMLLIVIVVTADRLQIFEKVEIVL